MPGSIPFIPSGFVPAQPGASGSGSGTAAGGIIAIVDGFGATATGPTVVFANSNSVSFGLAAGSQITASVAGITPETPFGISGGTQSVSTGTMVFSNSNNVTFGMSGSSRITASASFPAETPFGISGGTQSVSTGTLVFSNSNGVTFGMSGSSRITASVAAETPFGVSAGTQSVSTGTLVFSNSNNVSFGMSGSSRVTASFSETPFGVSAGTQSVSTGTLVFSNSNNVSFGMSGSSRVTASFSETPFGISAGTQSVSTGTMVFSNSNGVTFGMSGSSQITASVSSVVFSNSNNVTFGLNGSTLTASASAAPGVLSYFDNSAYGSQSAAFANLVYARQWMPSNISVTRVEFVAAGLAATTHSFIAGLYTMNGSTASLLSSGTGTVSITLPGTPPGLLVSMPVGTWNVTPGDYLIAVWGSGAGNATNRPSLMGAQNPGGNTAQSAYWDMGRTDATTLIASLALSNQTVANMTARPFLRLVGTF